MVGFVANFPKLGTLQWLKKLLYYVYRLFGITLRLSRYRGKRDTKQPFFMPFSTLAFFLQSARYRLIQTANTDG